MIWPDTYVEEGNLTQHISLLRKVLGQDADGQRYIETIPKRGYRFAAAVSVVDADEHSRETIPPARLWFTRRSALPPLRKQVPEQPSEALHWLQYTNEDGFPCYPLFQHDANLDALRAEPRFVSLLDGMKREWDRRKSLFAE